MGWFILFGITLFIWGLSSAGDSVVQSTRAKQGSPLYVGQALSIPAWMTSRAVQSSGDRMERDSLLEGLCRYSSEPWEH